MGSQVRVGLVVLSLVAVAACTGDDDGADQEATSTTGAQPTSAASATSPSTSPPTSPRTTAVTTTPATSGPPVTSAPDAPGYEATIRRTTDGVPHIIGDSYADVVFGEGYANATDHACTLADQMLKIRGRRAAALGAGDDEANIESDFAWLAIGIDERARHDYESAPAEIVDMFEAYAAGWNSYLDEVGIDGLSGWCAGADWVTPLSSADVYAYARSVSLLASSGAITQFISSAKPPKADETGSTATTVGGLLQPADLGSNGWALGADAVTGGTGGMLLANPHFPWEGERRFWEVHLTVPGELNIYGAMLIGLPGVGIGFTDEFAWTHTVSAGHRFTAYTLDLDPADPTRYFVDGESRAMTSRRFTVSVRRPNGRMVDRTRTMWSSEYGPIIDFPGFGWTADKTITYRDANIDNDEFAEQYLAMNRAKSFDEFVDAHRRDQGVPLFNTIAVSRDGRAWYADTSATPKLSRRAERLYRQRLVEDPITAIAADNGAVLLDGSNSVYQWEEVEGSRDPGLVPFDEMPMVERTDYVFNANDSFWMPHATEMLEGGYSILHGAQRTERSLRTRENAIVLSGGRADTPAGRDRTFTSEELRTAALANHASSERFLLDGVVRSCRGMTVQVPELTGDDGSVALPATSVDLQPGCDVLAGWDGRFDLDSRGAVLWREFLTSWRRDHEGSLDDIWRVPFDADDPVETPRAVGDSTSGAPGAVVIALARATQTLDKAGYPLDVTLGETQYALRASPRIAINGGYGGEGVTNVVGYADPSGTSEPMRDPGEPIVPGSTLRPDGYPVDNGTSFLMAVDFTAGDPEAWAILDLRRDR